MRRITRIIKNTDLSAGGYYKAGDTLLILCDCTQGNITLTLPSALMARDVDITIRKIDTSANTVTINTKNSQVINVGASSVTSVFLIYFDDTLDIGSNFATGWEGIFTDGFGDTYDDLQIPITTVKVDAVNPPTFTAYKGGQVLAFAKNVTNKIYFNAQFPHGMKLMSSINFHLHNVFPTTGSGNILWRTTYSWTNVNEIFPTEITVNSLMASSGVTDKHVIANIIPTITPNSTQGGLSSFAICSLARVGGDASDTYDNDAYLISGDFHLLKDSVGSRQPFIK